MPFAPLISPCQGAALDPNNKRKIMEKFVKKRAGRKALPIEKIRKNFAIRLSPDELDQLRSDAEFCGMSVADFIRKCSVRNRPVTTTPAVNESVRSELRRIGVNINQLVAAANSSGRINLLPSDLELLHELLQTIDELREALR